MITYIYNLFYSKVAIIQKRVLFQFASCYNFLMGKHIIRNKEVMKRFGNKLREKRLEKNVTQEELSYRTGIALSSIARCETGTLNTSISTVVALAKGLDISPKDFFD